jgi:hypothetical protein
VYEYQPNQQEDIMKVAIIPADDTKPIRFTEIENTLAAKQKIVDGYIEAVRLRANEYGAVAMDFYCNEEFLYREDLEPNMRASAMYLFSFGAKNVICGDVVCIGGVGPDGEDLPLNAEQEAFLKFCFTLTTED